MSLLGADVGTTGCKAAAFSEKGTLLASAYEEYDLLRPQPGWAELYPAHVWIKIQATIRRVSAATASDPIRALAVSSLGEAMVRLKREFEPDSQQHERYAEWYGLYKQLWPTTSQLLRALAARQGCSPA